MTTLTLATPAMYADHHVVEVRRLLFGVSGVEEVDASAAFRAVEVGFDPDKTTEETVRAVLDEAGYLDELPIPAETGEPADGRDSLTFFRHTAAVENAGDTISFGQEVLAPGRPLWPCPGMAVPARADEGGAGK